MKKIILVVSVLLSGCVTTPTAIPAPILLTDQQISEASDAALCSMSNTNPDHRINVEIESRKTDCEYAALVCAAKGIKRGTTKFSECKNNQRIEQEEVDNKTQYAARREPSIKQTVAANNTQATPEQDPSCGFIS